MGYYNVKEETFVTENEAKLADYKVRVRVSCLTRRLPFSCLETASQCGNYHIDSSSLFLPLSCMLCLLAFVCVGHFSPCCVPRLPTAGMTRMPPAIHWTRKTRNRTFSNSPNTKNASSSISRRTPSSSNRKNAAT